MTHEAPHHQHHTNGSSNGHLSAADPDDMAAISTIINPAVNTKFLVFYSDKSLYLTVTQQYLVEPLLPKPPGKKPPQEGPIAALPDGFPPGRIANPSSIAAVKFDGLVNVFGVIKGEKEGQLFLTRLSPALDIINVGEQVLATTPAVMAAASDGNKDGRIFFVAVDAVTRRNVVKYAPLPHGNPDVVRGLNVHLNPKTYIGAAYGIINKERSYVIAVQDEDDFINLMWVNHGIHTIPTLRGARNTPIAVVFVEGAQPNTFSIVVYYFGPLGSGPDRDTMPLIRAVTPASNLDDWVPRIASAPASNGYTQIGAFSHMVDDTRRVWVSYIPNNGTTVETWVDTITVSAKGKGGGEKE